MIFVKKVLKEPMMPFGVKVDNMKKDYYNRLEITVIPVKQKKPTFKKTGEHTISSQFIIKPNYIKIWQDDTTVDVYKRIKGSCYWKCVGLPGYEFAIISRLSI